jgi:formylmethanofuran dehydrogenase subunit E
MNSLPNPRPYTATSARGRCSGVQMGRLAAELLGLDLPQSDKRLLTIVETDGCFTTGLSVATNCWVGRRTMRVEDYGKVAATFVDTARGHGAPRCTWPDRA